MTRNVQLMVVGYFTLGTPYEAEAERLRGSLARVGMSHSIVGLPRPSDSWHDGVALKPHVIRAALNAFGVPVLYVDVDAYFHADCTEHFANLRADYDFAAHYFHGAGAGGREQGGVERHLLSGTLWWNQTPVAHALVARWCELNERTYRCGDETGRGQRNLATIVADPAGYGLASFRLWKLAGRYCYVYRRPECYPDAERENKVIEHTLASRENKDESRGRVDESRQARIAELDAAVA